MAEGIMSTSTTIKQVMRALAALQDPKMREANERRGDDHGVNLTYLRVLAKLVGWVEHSETHLPIRGKAMGFAKAQPILRAARPPAEIQATAVGRA
jgi:hypothetical protein